MEELWDRVRSLAGQTLETVAGAKFDVLEVGDRKVMILLHSSGRSYPVYRREFAKAEQLGLVTGHVRPQELRDKRVSEGKPAYVAAIIHAITR